MYPITDSPAPKKLLREYDRETRDALNIAFSLAMGINDFPLDFVVAPAPGYVILRSGGTVLSSGTTYFLELEYDTTTYQIINARTVPAITNGPGTARFVVYNSQQKIVGLSYGSGTTDFSVHSRQFSYGTSFGSLTAETGQGVVASSGGTIAGLGGTTGAVAILSADRFLLFTMPKVETTPQGFETLTVYSCKVGMNAGDPGAYVGPKVYVPVDVDPTAYGPTDGFTPMTGGFFSAGSETHFTLRDLWKTQNGTNNYDAFITFNVMGDLVDLSPVNLPNFVYDTASTRSMFAWPGYGIGPLWIPQTREVGESNSPSGVVYQYVNDHWESRPFEGHPPGRIWTGSTWIYRSQIQTVILRPSSPTTFDIAYRDEDASMSTSLRRYDLATGENTHAWFGSTSLDRHLGLVTQDPPVTLNANWASSTSSTAQRYGIYAPNPSRTPYVGVDNHADEHPKRPHATVMVEKVRPHG